MSSLDLSAAAAAPRSAPTVGAPNVLAAGEQHSLARSVVMHLLPGLAGLAVFLLTAPILAAAGWPALFAFYGPMTATIVAVEGGYLLYARRRSQPGMHAMAARPASIGLPRYAILAVGLVIVGMVATGVLSIVDQALVSGVFASLPAWWLVTDPSTVTSSPAALLAVTLVVGFAMNGLVGPIVEEAYFRGHLLPRLSRFGSWAPVINASLFSLYHFWQPWAFLSRLGYVLPYVIAVHRTRSVALGIVVHATANLLGLVVLFNLALS